MDAVDTFKLQGARQHEADRDGAGGRGRKSKGYIARAEGQAQGGPDGPRRRGLGGVGLGYGPRGRSCPEPLSLIRRSECRWAGKLARQRSRANESAQGALAQRCVRASGCGVAIWIVALVVGFVIDGIGIAGLIATFFAMAVAFVGSAALSTR